MNLHVGYLIQQFPPEVGAGAARAAEMAAHWISSGARVTVITGMPNRPEGRIHPAYRGHFFVRERQGNLAVLRSWLYASPQQGTVRTLANNASFALTSALVGLFATERFDVLIASSPPFFPHGAGRIVAARRRIPLVLEVRDLWPDYLVQMGMFSSTSTAAKSLFAAERTLLRKAAAVTVVTESFRKRIIGKGVSPERVFVMPNGVDTGYYFRSEEAPPLDCLRRVHGDEFLVGYLGNFGAGQGLSTVLEAAATLRDSKPRVRFVLAGDGPQAGQLREDARRLGLTNVTIENPIPKTSTRAFYANCDICVVPLAPIPVFQETLPSKMFEIMACERPFIAGLEGEGARIVEQSGAGWTVAPGEPAALAAAILRAKDAPRAEREAMGRRGREYAAENYSRGRIASRYLDLLDGVVSRHRKLN